MTRCPYCCAMLSTSQSLVPGHTPHSGDLTVCAFCLSWTIFDQDMALRKPIIAEIEQIQGDPRCGQILRNMKALHGPQPMTAH